MSDLRQSIQYAQYLKKIGWEYDKTGKNLVFIKHLPLLGNFLKIQRPLTNIEFDQLQSLVKKHKAFAVKIDYSPTKTLQIDLAPSLQQIQNQMKKDGRYGIRKAEKNKIKTQVYSYPNPLINNFISLWHKNAWRRGFWIPFHREMKSLYEAFGEKCYLIFTYQEPNQKDKPLSGAFIIVNDKTAHYFHAASSPEGRKLSAPYLIIWEAIKLAKKKKCKTFDFEGLYDERFPIKSWKGFTHFKKSFGGTEVKFPGPKTKFYNPLFRLFSK